MGLSQAEDVIHFEIGEHTGRRDNSATDYTIRRMV
jgi:hypothetical protein